MDISGTSGTPDYQRRCKVSSLLGLHVCLFACSEGDWPAGLLAQRQLWFSDFSYGILFPFVLTYPMWAIAWELGLGTSRHGSQGAQAGAAARAEAR